MTKPSRDFTMSEYLGVIKRHRSLILIVALVAAGAAFGVSAAMKTKYTATATLNVTDPNATSNVVGGTSFIAETQLQLASAAMPQVTRQAVAQQVKQQLGSTQTISQLQNDVSVSVNPNSYVLDVAATSPSATRAAAIANAFATTDANLTTNAARAQYAQQAAAVQAKIKHANATAKALDEVTLLRLQNLATVAQPISVQQLATVPTSPSSPKPVRNTIAALIIGLLLGIAIAVGRDALDRRMRKVSDITDEVDLPVLGNVPATALGAPGTTRKRPKGNRAILTDRDEESFRILRQNVAFLAAGEDRHTIVVTSPMPQEGKSTVAAGLAMAFAQVGKSTLLVECDLRRPVLGDRFGIRQNPGLSDYLTGHAQPEQILQPIASTMFSVNGNGAHPDGVTAGQLVCITSGSTVPLPAQLLGSEKFRAFLAEVGQAYDAVVLDTPPLLPLADTLEIIPQASTLLLCVRLNQTTRDQAHAAEAALTRLPPLPTGLVVTAVKDQVEAYYGYYYTSQRSKTAAGVGN